MNRIRLFLSFIILLILSSCSFEYKLAKEFQQDPPDFYLKVKPPAHLFKYNHKGEMIEDFEKLSGSQQDSALDASSFFTRHIDDSVFLERYVNGFVDELRKLDFKVYLGDEADSFLLQQAQSYLIDMIQVQLDEYFYPFEDKEYYYDTLYYKSVNLNAVDFSTWIELGKLKSSRKQKTVLYSSHMATDDFAGSFLLDPFRQDVKYSYTIDSLSVPDIYEIAGFLGKVHASYLYDFFLNQYIAFNLPQGFRPEVYYHYNRFRKSFVVVEEERFELLESK